MKVFYFNGGQKNIVTMLRPPLRTSHLNSTGAIWQEFRSPVRIETVGENDWWILEHCQLSARHFDPNQQSTHGIVAWNSFFFQCLTGEHKIFAFGRAEENNFIRVEFWSRGTHLNTNGEHDRKQGKMSFPKWERRTLGLEGSSMSQPYHQRQLRQFKIPSKLKSSCLCRHGSFEQQLVTQISCFKVCELVWILIRFQISGTSIIRFLGPWDHHRIFVVHPTVLC